VGIKHLQDLVALQLATAFKREVYRIVRSSPDATTDLRYRGQLFDAASGVEANLAEGWQRYVAADFALFVRYAMSSRAEARQRIQDGIDRGYLREADCQPAFTLAARCGAATMNLHKSLRRLAAASRRR
jgi:four helix bundle protein